MGRAPCCQKVGLKRGRWTAEEDQILIKYIQDNGEGSWRALPKNAGLLRCGKSCRLRWINYLRKDLKRGNITPQEEDLIIKLHATIGNRWSLIATQLPGRTDNEVKNHWNSHLSRSINTWRRPANDTLPQHIIDDLAKRMTKPNPSTKKDSKKHAPITINEKGDHTHEEIDDSISKPKTSDVLKESVSSNSWNTDQSLESIFSLEDHEDLVDGVDIYVDIISLNEMVTHMDHLITMPDDDHHQSEERVSNEFQNLDDGAIDIEFMNDLTNLSTSHAEMDTSIITTTDDNNTTLKSSLSSSSSSITSSLYNFNNDPLMNMNDWSYWKDYSETLDEDLINHEEFSSFLMPWLWDDCDDLERYGP